MSRTRGRKPIPSYLKVLRGNPGNRKLNPDEPEVPKPKTIPQPPADISPAALQVWHRIAPMLYDVGVLTDLEVPVLHSYCESEVRWLDNSKKLAASGSVVKDRWGAAVLSPYFRAVHIEQKAMMAALTELGMTPSSRSRIIVKSSEEAIPGMEGIFQSETEGGTSSVKA